MNFEQWHLWLASRSARPLVMGVVNCTPDSFSEGNHFPTAVHTAEFALQLARDGADLLDIGGESTRPGSHPVAAAEQIARILPVIEEIRRKSDVAISIDTTCGAVIRAALPYRISLINDISAGRADAEMFPLAAAEGLAIVLMHMQGNPLSMQDHPTYSDVVPEVRSFLVERRDSAIQRGVDPQRILLDPGIGFGKTTAHNLALLRDLRQLTDLGPLVVGTSRKGFIGKVLGEPNPARRLMGTAASVAWIVANGASIVRVHDVREMSQVVRMICAIGHGEIARGSECTALP